MEEKAGLWDYSAIPHHPKGWCLLASNTRMKKRIQFKLNERIFAVEINTENIILNDEDINNAREELEKQIQANNETIQNIFWQELLLVCSECGISLNEDELETGVCLGCEANKNE